MAYISKQTKQVILVAELWYLHKHELKIQSIYVTLYIQTSVSENTQNAVSHTPLPPLHTTLHQTFCHQHQSSLHTQYSMVPFCKCPHPSQ